MAWRRGREMVSLGSLFDAALPRSPRARARLLDEAAWRRVVGVNVARRTLPIRVDGGALVIRVATSAWAQELSLLKATLLERVAVEGVAARDVRFVVGPVDPPQRSPEVQVRVPYLPRLPLPRDLLAAIEKIDDPELRRSLARAAQTNLSWQALTREPPVSSRLGVSAPRRPTVPMTEPAASGDAPRAASMGGTGVDVAKGRARGDDRATQVTSAGAGAPRGQGPRRA